jgi:signal transduction histidine kinase
MLSAPAKSLSRSIFTACDSLGDGMVIVDDTRVIRYMNPAAYRLAGLSPGSPRRAVRCQAVLQCGLMGELNQFCERCQVRQALQRGEGTVQFSAAIGPLQQRVWVDASCTPVLGLRPFAILFLRPRFRASAQALPPGDLPLEELAPHSTAVLQGLVRSARELLVADYAALGRLDEARLEVFWLVQEGSRSPVTNLSRVPLGRGIRGRVISTGQPVYIPDFPFTAPDPPDQHPTMQNEGLRSALAVPVPIRGESTGVLMVASRHPAEYGPDQTQVLRNLAGLAGEVLNHADWVVSAQAASIRAEREWLAAELHDGLAQLLGAITQRLKLARWVLGRSTDAATLAADLQEVLELSEEAHQELRLALGELRTPAAEGDFREALVATLLSFTQRSGLQAELVEVPEQRPPLPSPVTLQVLRIVQEALNNARKHSGGSHIWVRWIYTCGMHTFIIKDDGRGFDQQEAGRGFGLTIMADRAHRIGGELQVRSSPDAGCTVVLTVPDHRGEGAISEPDSGAAG